MTEIQQYQPGAPAPMPGGDALDALMRQAEAMNAAHKLGSALAGTNMVPKDYQGKPDNATAAILYGAEVGLTAIQSLQGRAPVSVGEKDNQVANCDRRRVRDRYTVPQPGLLLQILDGGRGTPGHR
ncbi:hypothetical protein [Rhodococcus sp. NPDC058639]|uniref:hypothetical protein n=1 Tax=Rhodococcus sp. NPDC058639 TaxID=3346570 RepID=UPI003665E3EF